jgi:hypothetical protein
MTAVLLTLVSLLMAGMSAYAHDSRPVSVDLREIAPQVYRLNYVVPPSVARDNYPTISLDCPQKDGLYQCDKIDTPHLVFAYPDGNPALTALVKFKSLEESQKVVVIPPQQTEWALTTGSSPGANALRYGHLGIFHILSGFDHLLFITLLCFIARQRLIITITGFTLAHSVTLALASLGMVRLSVAAVEASIALSIVFMAAELIRADRQTLMWRYPFSISAGFGLLHGFGFATVLRDIGLPEGQTVLALGAFNIGVEIGQLAFIVALFIMHRLLLTLRLPLPSMPQIAWAAGLVAAFWMWQRLALAL